MLEPDEVLDLLDAQVAGLHCDIRSIGEDLESDGDGTIPAERVNSVRTEVIELQAAVEDLLAGQCDGTEPWEYAGEHIPATRLWELVGASDS